MVRALGKRNCIGKGFVDITTAHSGRFVIHLWLRILKIFDSKVSISSFLKKDFKPTVLSLQSPVAQRQANNVLSVDAETQCSPFAIQRSTFFIIIIHWYSVENDKTPPKKRQQKLPKVTTSHLTGWVGSWTGIFSAFPLNTFKNLLFCCKTENGFAKPRVAAPPGRERARVVSGWPLRVRSVPGGSGRAGAQSSVFGVIFGGGEGSGGPGRLSRKVALQNRGGRDAAASPALGSTAETSACAPE